MTKINRRAVAQVLIILLLALLLVFDGTSPLKDARRQGQGETKAGFKDAPFSANERLKEKPATESDSPPEEPKAVIDPLSHSGWVNGGGYEVFGQVENIGSAGGREVTARVTFKGSDWQQLGRAEALIDRPTLGPGEKSAFKVRFKTDQPDAVKTYVLIMTVAR